MLTENRKRRRSGGGGDQQDGQQVPQAKRQSHAHRLSPAPGRDAGESESSTNESSGISSPEQQLVGSCSSQFAVDALTGPRGAPDACGPLASLADSSSSSFSSFSSSGAAGRPPLLSYHQINRILREAHFQSLHSRGQPTDT